MLEQIPKQNLLFLDTNILSAIGKQSSEDIKKIAFKLTGEIRYMIALTAFNIVELEKMPDKSLLEKIREFLQVCNIAFFIPQIRSR